MLVLVTYRARPGCEEALAGLLRTHVARLAELGLLAPRPHFVARDEETEGQFVESFWWRDAGAPHLAQDHAEVQELWMRVEDFCLPEGVVQRRLRPLD